MGEKLSVKEFEKLRNLAIEKLSIHTRWCMKKGKTTTLQELDAEECVDCEAFVLNGGNCDPI